MCGIYTVAFYALINLRNAYDGAITLIDGYKPVSGNFELYPPIAGYIGAALIIIVYLPEVVFFYFVVKYKIGGDTIKGRRGLVIGMKCLVANAFLTALVVFLFGLIIGAIKSYFVVFLVLIIIWVPQVVSGLFLTWWMTSTKAWYHELVMAENGGQIPQDMKMYGICSCCEKKPEKPKELGLDGNELPKVPFFKSRNGKAVIGVVLVLIVVGVVVGVQPAPAPMSCRYNNSWVAPSNPSAKALETLKSLPFKDTNRNDINADNFWHVQFCCQADGCGGTNFADGCYPMVKSGNTYVTYKRAFYNQDSSCM